MCPRECSWQIYRLFAMSISRLFFGVVLVALSGTLVKEGLAAWLHGNRQRHRLSIPPVDGGRYGNCKVTEQTTCWCGEGTHRQQTVVDIKQCEYYTSWGPECEPCVSEEKLCQSLENCARCPRHNPNAICSDCPPGRWGLRCENERPCKTPNITEYMTVHPYFTKRDVYKMEFRCTDGRVRVGPKALRCRHHSGKWNEDPPKCVLPMRCSSLPSSPIPFTRVKEESHGRLERVVYECDTGYISSGKVLETVLQCENGAWVQIGDSVQCEPSPKCASPPMNIGARLKLETPVKSLYHSGERVHLECKDAFRPVRNDSQNNFTLICSGKQWLGLAPDCELKGCKKLTIDHGSVTYNISSNFNSSQSDYLPRDTRAYAVCQRTFMPENPEPATCSETGRWEPSPPRCIPKACEDVIDSKMCSVRPTSDNVTAETNKTEIYPGQTAKFKCKDGTYRKLGEGQTERICIHNGTLSGSEIQCTLVPVCKVILPPGDPHITYCRGQQCTQIGSDFLQEKTYELPPDVVPPFSRFEFSCDTKYHCVNGSDHLMCPLSKNTRPLQAPRCIPRCGVRNVPLVPQIMGGKASHIVAWPWQAALMEVQRNQADFSCGATLVDERWAITAAHCVTFDKSTEIKDSSLFRLTYGLSSSTDARMQARNKEYEEKFGVASIFIHDDYDANFLHNDIALLQLKTPAEIGHHVGVACLPTGDNPLQGGEEGMVTGWGQMENERLSPLLQELPLTVINASHCEEFFKEKGYNGKVLTDGIFCAISNSSLEDATDGDSGGPFVVEDADRRWVLEGIVSWGLPENPQQENVNKRAHVRLSKGGQLLPTCTGSACFGGYTRVAKYIQWIRQTTNGEVGYKSCS